MSVQELEVAKKSGGLSDIIYCFSQEAGMPRTYVQDGIDINADRLAALLATPHAHFYLSGAFLSNLPFNNLRCRDQAPD